jgi:hypothetical protein
MKMNLQISTSVMRIHVTPMLYAQTHPTLSCAHVLKASLEPGLTVQVSYFVTNYTMHEDIIDLQILMSVLTILVILMLHVQTHLALSCVPVMKDSMELGSTVQVSYSVTN